MDNTALFRLSYGLYVVGVKNGESYGGSVVDAFAQVGSGKTPMVVISCMNINNTTSLIEKSGEFTVSVLATDVDPFVIANFGFQSSRDTEKWKNVPHVIVNGLPVLTDAAAYLRCKVESVTKLDTHDLYLCSVEDAWLGEGEPLLYADYQKPQLKNAVREAFAAFKAGQPHTEKKEDFVKDENGEWVCSVCGYRYKGDIPFEELPDDFTCPVCGQPKSVFEKR